MPEPTAKMQKAAICLAQGASLAATAKACKVAERTINTWKRDNPEFLEEVQRCHRVIYGEALQLAARKAGEIVTFLANTALDEKMDMKYRLMAAKQVLDAGVMFVRHDQETRIRRIEEALDV